MQMSVFNVFRSIYAEWFVKEGWVNEATAVFFFFFLNIFFYFLSLSIDSASVYMNNVVIDENGHSEPW